MKGSKDNEEPSPTMDNRESDAVEAAESDEGHQENSTQRQARPGMQRRFSVDRINAIQLPEVSASQSTQEKSSEVYETNPTQNQRRSKLERRFSMDRIQAIQLPGASKSRESESTRSSSFKTNPEEEGASENAPPQRKIARRLSMDNMVASSMRNLAVPRRGLERRHSLDHIDVSDLADLGEQMPRRLSNARDFVTQLYRVEDELTRRASATDPNAMAAAASFVRSSMARDDDDEPPSALRKSALRSKNDVKKSKRDKRVSLDNTFHTKETSSAVSVESGSEDSSSDIDTLKGHKEGSANIPHEALEYPPLYFFLKRFPVFMGCVQSFYRVRWSMTYPLQRRVPFSKALRKIGFVYTWGELLLGLPFIAILVWGALTSFWRPDVSLSGHVSRLPLALAFLTANHNSLLTLFMGIPFERALKFHKLAGRIAFINGVFHTYVAFVHPTRSFYDSHTGIAPVKYYEDMFEEAEKVVKVCEPKKLNNQGGLKKCQDLCFDKMCCFEKGDESCIDEPKNDCLAFAACENLMDSPLFNLEKNIANPEDFESIGIGKPMNTQEIASGIEPPLHSYIGKEPNFATFTIDGQINMSGTAILLLIFSMLVTSLPRVRRLVFEVFFYIHVLFAALMIACAFFHSGIFVVALAGALWGGDLFFRKLLMAGCRYPHNARIQNLTDTVVEISFPKTKGFDYNPGQYVYLAIPAVSLFEWHPFSISSSPHQETVTIHVRKRGNWTKALFKLAEKKEKVKILMEGPYGALGVDIFSQRYKIMMLLSGGIGVTPMQSICHQLMHEHDNKERTLKRLWFVWTARDPEVMENMDVTQHGSRRFSTRSSIKTSVSIPPSADIRKNLVRRPTTSRLATRILTEFPNSDTPDEVLERELPLDEYESDDGEEFEDEDETSEFDIVYRENEPSEIKYPLKDGPPSSIKFQQVSSFPNMRQDVSPDVEKPKMTERPKLTRGAIPDEENLEDDDEVLKLDFFLTAKEMPEDGAMMPFISKGRPNLKSIFLQMREEAIRAGEKRIAICVCAPTRLVTICRKACAKYSNKKVRFDFHSEVFD